MARRRYKPENLLPPIIPSLFWRIVMVERSGPTTIWFVEDMQTKTLKRYVRGRHATARELADRINPRLRQIKIEREHERWTTYYAM